MNLPGQPNMTDGLTEFQVVYPMHVLQSAPEGRITGETGRGMNFIQPRPDQKSTNSECPRCTVS